MARANPPLSGAFLAEMTRHLQGQSRYFAFANSWLENRLAEQGLTIEQLVGADGQAQAADQVSIGNSINSLRFLSSNDWREFVENHSLVEQILREDPAQRLRRHGFRHARPLPARGGRDRQAKPVVGGRGCPRSDSARRTASRVRRAPTTAHGPRRLLPDRSGPDRFGTQRRDAIVRAAERRPNRQALSPVLLSGRRPADRRGRVGGLPRLGRARVARTPLLLGLLASADPDVRRPSGRRRRQLAGDPVGASAAAAADGFPRTAIPPEHRTMVVVPTMLSKPEAVADLLEGLEVRYLANRDSNLHFALLTDLEDAAQEVMPEDEELVRLAQEGIEQLNQKYRGPSDRHFLPLPSPAPLERAGRRVDGLRAQARQTHRIQRPAARGQRIGSPQIVGDTTVLPQVRYVITLDTDTQLPRDAARRNGRGDGPHPQPARVRPEARPGRRRLRHFAAARRREPAERPAVLVRAPVRAATRVSTRTRASCRMSIRICSAKVRSSARASTTSTPSCRCCNGFPENAILSHDLLESAYARSALLERCGAVRGLSLALSHGRQPAASLDSRRLADRRLVAAAGSAESAASESRTRSRSCRGGRSSTTFAAAWCRSRWWLFCWARGCWRPVAGTDRDIACSGGGRDGSAVGGAGRPGSQADRLPLLTHSALTAARSWANSWLSSCSRSFSSLTTPS